MTVETMPQVVDDDRDDDDMVHLVCCNPRVAMCGADLGDDALDADGEEIECVVCSDLDGKPCGALLCPVPPMVEER